MKILSMIFGSIIFLNACRHTSDETSAVKHDPARFFNNADPRQWVAIDEARFLRSAAPNPVLKPDHEMTSRLQAWADVISSEILKTAPSHINVPRPIIRIVIKAEPNAFVETQKRCIDRSIVYSATANLRKDLYISLTKDGPSSKKRDPSCVTFEGDVAEASSYFQWYFRSLEGCKAKPEGETIFVTRGCLDKFIYVNYAGAQLASLQNYVTVYAGTLTRFNEAEIVATLAHELAHYYMAHAIQSPQMYSYFYRMGPGNSLAKPEALKHGDSINPDEKGFYTIEQEADDMALEMLYRLGLDPFAEITKSLKYLKLRSVAAYEKCKTEYEKGFPNAIPMGDLSDLHHDSCYRAYNSYREMKAHAVFFESIRRSSPSPVEQDVKWEVAVAHFRDDVLNTYAIAL